MLDEKKKDAMRVAASDFEKKHTPLPGNKCHCGGDIFRPVAGLAFGKFFYSLPRCASCGRMYLHANYAPTRGEKEFLEILSMPMTI
jgi:hypothetical protein